MSSNPDDRSRGGHPLEAIPALPASSLVALRRQWLETAEQVLAVSATPEGRSGLQSLLSFSPAELGAFLDSLAKVVGPETAARLTLATPGGSVGVVLTPEQKQRFGLK